LKREKEVMTTEVRLVHNLNQNYIYNIGLTVGLAAIVASIVYIFTGMGSANVKFDSDSKESENSNDVAKGGKKDKSEVKESKTKVTVYFGSQTGTAEGFARTIVEESSKNGFEAKMVDLEEFKPNTLQTTTMAIFLMATYGEGEPTDNAISFYKWLKNESGESQPDTLSSLNFTVFGLGNKQYEHFNRMGKFTNRTLEEFGAKRVVEYGEGDDDANLEEDFDRWRTSMWPALSKHFHQKEAPSDDSTDNELPALKYAVETISTANYVSHRDLPLSELSRDLPLAVPMSRHFFSSARLPVLVNRELRTPLASATSSVGSTRHIELQLPASMSYLTADNVAVLPENSPQLVSEVAAAMGYSLEQVLQVSDLADSSKKPFPLPVSVRDLLTLYLDLTGELRHSTAKLLLRHLHPSVSSERREAFQQLLRDENRAQFRQLHLSLGALLALKEPLLAPLTVAQLLSAAPLMQPRYYTSSSSSSLHPQQVHLTVSVTRYPLAPSPALASSLLAPSSDPAEPSPVFTGLCSGYLSELSPGVGNSCRAFVRASSFRLPADVSTPIVMVGPGTGIAPMRALLQEREHQKATGANVLFFGCQHSEVDFLYKQELQAFRDRGVLSELHLAFSRQHPGGSKVYVQHLMLKTDTAASLATLVVDQGAYVYVCGATAMGADVSKAFVQVLEGRGVDGAQYVKDMQETGRYVQELWSV